MSLSLFYIIPTTTLFFKRNRASLVSQKERTTGHCRRHRFDPWFWNIPCASLLCSWDFTGKNTGVDSHFLFQGILLTQGLNSHLLHWQVDSFPLCHQGSLILQYIIAERKGFPHSYSCLINNNLGKNCLCGSFGI